METLPIDFDLTLTQLYEWHDKWRLERFGSNDNTRYYQTDGRYLYGVIQDTELCEEKAIQERVLELLCLIRKANMKLKGIGLNWHLTYQERENIKSTREALYKELTELLKKETYLPKELNSDKASIYFAKAKENGLIDDNYKWLKGMQLLACFCHDMSQKLNMGKGGRTAWKPFEKLFGIAKGKLRSNYNDIQKTGQSPSDIALVDSIFQ